MRGTWVCLLRVLGLLIVEVLASVAVRAGIKELLRGYRKKLKRIQTKKPAVWVFKAQEHRCKNEGKKGQDSNRESCELTSMAQV